MSFLGRRQELHVSLKIRMHVGTNAEVSSKVLDWKRSGGHGLHGFGPVLSWSLEPCGNDLSTSSKLEVHQFCRLEAIVALGRT